MCDAVSCNFSKLPKPLEIIVGNCNAHSRRRYVNVVPNFPKPREGRYHLVHGVNHGIRTLSPRSPPPSCLGGRGLEFIHFPGGRQTREAHFGG